MTRHPHGDLTVHAVEHPSWTHELWEDDRLIGTFDTERSAVATKKEIEVIGGWKTGGRKGLVARNVSRAS